MDNDILSLIARIAKSLYGLIGGLACQSLTVLPPSGATDEEIIWTANGESTFNGS